MAAVAEERAEQTKATSDGGDEEDDGAAAERRRMRRVDVTAAEADLKGLDHKTLYLQSITSLKILAPTKKKKMASLNSHGHSLSLPSESQLATSEFDSNLSRIRSSEAASTSSLLSINEKLNTLHKLYVSIDDSLVFAHISQITSQEEKQILDGYVSLLDPCSSAQDLVSSTKQQVQEISSSIRRNDANGVSVYLTCRKRMKKMIERSLKNLKSSIVNVKGHESIVAVRMLKEAESVTVSVLESLLSCMMENKTQSLIFKLMHSKKEVIEFDKINSMLRTSQEDVQVVNHLKVIDSSIGY